MYLFIIVLVCYGLVSVGMWGEASGKAWAIPPNMLLLSSLVAPLLAMIIYALRQGNRHLGSDESQNESRRMGAAWLVWRLAPSVTLYIAILTTFGLFVIKVKEGKSPDAALISELVSGLLTGISTFIGVSIWAFTEFLSQTQQRISNDLTATLATNERALKEATGQMEKTAREGETNIRRLTWNQQVLLGKLTDAIHLLAPLTRQESGEESPDGEARRERLLEALDALYGNTAIWANRIAREDLTLGSEPSACAVSREVWVRLMQNYYYEEARDHQAKRFATNLRNYPHIIADILEALASELERRNNKGEHLALHYYGMHSQDPMGFFVYPTDGTVGESPKGIEVDHDRDRMAASLYRWAWNLKCSLDGMASGGKPRTDFRRLFLPNRQWAAKDGSIDLPTDINRLRPVPSFPLATSDKQLSMNRESLPVDVDSVLANIREMYAKHAGRVRSELAGLKGESPVVVRFEDFLEQCDLLLNAGTRFEKDHAFWRCLHSKSMLWREFDLLITRSKGNDDHSLGQDLFYLLLTFWQCSIVSNDQLENASSVLKSMCSFARQWKHTKFQEAIRSSAPKYVVSDYALIGLCDAGKALETLDLESKKHLSDAWGANSIWFLVEASAEQAYRMPDAVVVSIKTSFDGDANNHDEQNAILQRQKEFKKYFADTYSERIT